MSEQPADEQMATPEQLEELRSLAGDEDIPAGMRAAEAAQRIAELRAAG